MDDILKKIIEHKHREVVAAKNRRPLAQVQAEMAAAPPPRSFVQALTNISTPRVIAECKRQSPSRGVLLRDYDPVYLAKQYEQGGAAAISVLTDEAFFGGRLDHLTSVRQSVSVPVLRKDFIIDPYQIYETRAAGADTFLLLSGVLSQKELEAHLQIGRSLGMEPLIESHTAAEFEAALATTGQVFGINNRDLKTFTIDLENSRSLLSLAAPRTPHPIMVCESGIRGPEDVLSMRRAGYNAFLVGEGVAAHKDPKAAVAALVTVGDRKSD